MSNTILMVNGEEQAELIKNMFNDIGVGVAREHDGSWTISDFKLTDDGYKAGCTHLCIQCPRCNLPVYRTPIGWMACNLCGWSVVPCL